MIHAPIVDPGFTPIAVLESWKAVRPNDVFLRQPYDGAMREITWLETHRAVSSLVSYIRSLELPRSSHIAIVSKNCAEWLIADLAVWASGHVSVPLYANSTAESLRTVIEHSEAKLCFVGKLDDYGPVQKAIGVSLPRVLFRYAPDALTGVRLDEILATCSSDAKLEHRASDDLATIIYTSGTTGMPKGVMHSFRTMTAATVNFVETMSFTSKDHFFSYLPLAHCAERMLTECIALYCGGRTTFADSLATFGEDLRSAAPTVFLGVPRTWQKFQEAIYLKLPRQKLERMLAIPLVSTLIRRRIQQALGLQNVRLALVGAAPMPVDLLRFYDRLGIHILEGLGMSENFAYSHFNRIGVKRFGTVGCPMPEVECVLGDGDEVLLKGPSTMLGYYKDEEQTSAMFENGYLKTGDQGKTDTDGCLRVTGRVKDNFKTSKGKYVAPSPIEMRLLCSSDIDQACIVGTGLNQPYAILSLSDAAVTAEVGELSLRLQTLLEDTNKALEAHERIEKVIVVKDRWTVETGFLTPTLKVKRSELERCYSPRLEGWGSRKERIIFDS